MSSRKYLEKLIIATIKPKNTYKIQRENKQNEII